MNLDQLFGEPEAPPLRAGLIGVGEFGRGFVAQSRRSARIETLALCDRDPERARTAWLDAGVDGADIVLCDGRAAAMRALEAGKRVVVPEGHLLAELPLDVVLEATGEPEVAAANAEAALARGRHLVMVSKEADSVVGPLLNARARAAGLVCTPVDGDQPSLLIGLLGWARLLGLEVVAAGKASEYDFVHHPTRAVVAWRDREAPAGPLADLWRLPEDGIAAGLDARAAALPDFFRVTAPDLCEMGLVANASDLAPDLPGFHAPIARATELADIFRPAADGGLLAGPGRLDTFNCLRRVDEASFAGGVFVVARCPERTTGALLAGKGLPVSRCGGYVMLHNPVHLLGQEAPISVLSAGRLGRSTGAAVVRPRYDLVARAERPLPAGNVLELGARHVLPGLRPELRPAAAAAGGNPCPYYLAAGTRLAREVAAGALITCDDVAVPADSTLWRLRREQDRTLLADGEG